MDKDIELDLDKSQAELELMQQHAAEGYWSPEQAIRLAAELTKTNERIRYLLKLLSEKR